jgi:hypothetical protein
MANLVLEGRISDSHKTHLERELARLMAELGAFQSGLQAKSVKGYAEPC